MKRKWGKGDPVNLSDLLKITPVANEIIQIAEELEMSTTDVVWIVSQIIDNSEEAEGAFAKIFDNNNEVPLDEEWDEIDFENLENEVDHTTYTVNVKVSSDGRFPEVGFKAGMNDKEDITYFFEMVMEMLEKLE